MDWGLDPTRSPGVEIEVAFRFRIIDTKVTKDSTRSNLNLLCRCFRCDLSARLFLLRRFLLKIENQFPFTAQIELPDGKITAALDDISVLVLVFAVAVSQIV